MDRNLKKSTRLPIPSSRYAQSVNAPSIVNSENSRGRTSYKSLNKLESSEILGQYSGMLSPTELIHYSKAFKVLDFDGDGLITVSDLEQCLACVKAQFKTEPSYYFKNEVAQLCRQQLAFLINELESAGNLSREYLDSSRPDSDVCADDYDSEVESMTTAESDKNLNSKNFKSNSPARSSTTIGSPNSKIIYNTDEYGNACITFEDYLRLMCNHVASFYHDTQIGTDPQSLRQVFNLLDVNGDGRISCEEIKLALLNLGERITSKFSIE